MSVIMKLRKGKPWPEEGPQRHKKERGKKERKKEGKKEREKERKNLV
jgi:hypothetical protein